MQDFNHFKKKKKLNEAGKVIISPSNIITSPAKSGHFRTSVDHLFSPPYEYITEPYDRALKIERKLKKERSKLCKHDNAFKIAGPGGHFLGKIVWADKSKFPVQCFFPSFHFVKKKGYKSYRHVSHDQPFKLGQKMKSGPLATIGPYYQYKGNPIQRLLRKKKVSRDPYRLGYSHKKWSPSPSITSLTRNLRRMSTRR